MMHTFSYAGPVKKPLDHEKLLLALGKRVRELRHQKGLTQEDFDDATESGVTSRAIQLIEGGRKDVKLSTLAKIARRLEVPIAELFPR